VWPTTPTPSRDGRVWRPDERYAGLRLNEYAETARRFVWNELADWYLEASKSRLATPGDDQQVARSVLVHVFDRALRLLHPIVPFVTEALWQRLPGHVDGTFLATASWPVARAAGDARAADFDVIREIVESMRRVRSEYVIPPGKQIDAVIVAQASARQMLSEETTLLEKLARTSLTFADAAPTGPAASVILAGGTELIVPLAGLIDVKKECDRLKTELAGLEKQLAALEGRLANEGFTARAPAHVVEAERAKRDEWTTRRGMLRTRVEGLCGAA
jgi:valyl-tRNA synthetase